MYKKKILGLFILFFIISVTIPDYALNSANITIDTDNEYTLSVDASIDNVSEDVYAKFTKSKSDAENYYLLIEEDDSGAFEKAYKKLPVASEYYSVSGFNVSLFYEDPEGEKDDQKKKDPVTILVPIPDDSQEHHDHPEDYAFYQLSGGNLKLLDNIKQVSADDVYYVQFDLSSYGTYGFVYRNSDYYDKLEEEEENGDDPDEDNGDDENGDDDWDDNDNNEDENDQDNNQIDEVIPTGDELFDYETDDNDESFIYTGEEDEDFPLEDDSDYEGFYEYGEDDDILYFYGDDEENDDDAPYYYEGQDPSTIRKKQDDSESGENDSASGSGSGGPHSDSKKSSYSSYIIEGDNDEPSVSEVDVKREEAHTGSGSKSGSASGKNSKSNGTSSSNSSGKSKTNASRNSSGGNIIPKTGDTFPVIPLVGLGTVSSIGLIFCIIKLTNKKY